MNNTGISTISGITLRSKVRGAQSTYLSVLIGLANDANVILEHTVYFGGNDEVKRSFTEYSRTTCRTETVKENIRLESRRPSRLGALTLQADQDESRGN